ncbi:amidohydrolase family protein [Pseudonocardia spinosispora]|uniref:amidohydrolase family protein n=1 Tax=Pseudonocardia spinosispora TaxID=103441 RepID=UPI00040E29A2|nr:amidohydrolase family protein [Pseudonocardia spinosispora]
MIDVHAHYFPPAFTEAFARFSGGRKAWPEHPAQLDDRLSDLDAAGLERQLIGLGHNQPYFADADGSTEVSRLANDLYADAVAPWGGRLGAFGAIPLPHIDAAVAEAARCLDDLGFAGIGIGTTALGRSLSDPVFEPLWSELDRRGTTVFVHPVGTPDTVSTGLDSYLLGPKLGGPQEAGLAAIHLVVSGVTRRFPSIRWIISPMGGTVPYLWRRFEEITECLRQTQWLVDDLRGELRTLYYDTSLTDDPQVYRFMVDSLGADRLVLGTDAPRVTATDWIGRVRTATAGLGAADLERVLGGTARDELKL